MINLDYINNDVAAAIADMPGQIEWAGQIIEASVSPIIRRDDVSEMGELLEADVEAVASRSLFAGGVLPNVRQPVKARMSVEDEWDLFFVDERTLDAVSVNLKLRRQ